MKTEDNKICCRLDRKPHAQLPAAVRRERTAVPDAALEANPCPQPARVHRAVGRGAGRWESNLELIVERLAFFWTGAQAVYLIFCFKLLCRTFWF